MSRAPHIRSAGLIDGCRPNGGLLACEQLLSSDVAPGAAVPPLASVRRAFFACTHRHLASLCCELSYRQGCSHWHHAACNSQSTGGVPETVGLIPACSLCRHGPIDEWAPALVLFTSGSTAAPKAVPLTHAGLLWTAESKIYSEGHDSHAAAGRAHAGSVCMLPTFHVISLVCNVIFNLYIGARVVVDAEAARRPLSPEIVYEAVRQLRPSVLETVPWILEALAERISADPSAAGPLVALRHVVYGGAPLSARALRALHAAGVRVCTQYGQTELSMGCMLGFQARASFFDALSA